MTKKTEHSTAPRPDRFGRPAPCSAPGSIRGSARTGTTPTRVSRVTHGSSRRLKPHHRERILSDTVGVPDRTILPTGFVGAGRPARIHIVATDQALYIRAERRTTRMPWTEIVTFEQVADVFGNFVVGELRSGDSFRICLGRDQDLVGLDQSVSGQALS